MSKPRLAYILAASHSGSTLLALLLGSHPKACTVGELKGMRGNADTYRCSCGALIKECDFWLRVSAEMERRGVNFAVTNAGTNVLESNHAAIRRLLSPLHRGPFLETARDLCLAAMPGWHKHLTDVQKRNSALISTLLEVTGSEVLVDSSKVGLRLKYLLRNPDLDVRVLRLTRDGRGVAMTHTNPAEYADASKASLRSGGTGLVRPDYRLSIDEAAWLWRRSNEEADRVIARLRPSQCITLRYEDLCRDTGNTMRTTFDFLGLENVPIGAGFRAKKRQHVVGNGMRFDSSDVALDERWRTALSPEELAVFEQIGGELNRRYGYN